MSGGEKNNQSVFTTDVFDEDNALRLLSNETFVKYHLIYDMRDLLMSEWLLSELDVTCVVLKRTVSFPEFFVWHQVVCGLLLGLKYLFL